MLTFPARALQWCQLHQQERCWNKCLTATRDTRNRGRTTRCIAGFCCKLLLPPRLPNSSLALPSTSASPLLSTRSVGNETLFRLDKRTTQHRHLQLVPDGNNKLTKQRKIPAQRRKRRKALRDFAHRITSTKLRPPDMNHHSRKTGLPRIRIVSPSHQGANEADKVWDYQGGGG